MAMSRIQRYKKSPNFTTQTFLCTKITRVHLLNPLLYGTDAKVRKKSVFHNTDLLKNRLTMKSKKICHELLTIKVKQIIRNSNTYVGFYFSAIPYADLYAQ